MSTQNTNNTHPSRKEAAKADPKKYVAQECMDIVASFHEADFNAQLIKDAIIAILHDAWYFKTKGLVSEEDICTLIELNNLLNRISELKEDTGWPE